ncbi:hypothetical protein P3S67_020026 [Capsicum chacoense]|uniref:uncharacterized protein LOC107879540 n=1 Tax=Capsicum annuum TaxID=4072 RepID=UPI0007BFCC82|nr:uncharacterized protein LOC107879540 [Capsicum annuum]KAF3621724.1 putative bifunctional dihydrofolate reductase-thymidylate synthase-like [Capsicum annuum]KAF3638919.1 putative bifunctional dihydrofolate reductase-thymidylate synthase-like [Capsicum annuum]
MESLKFQNIKLEKANAIQRYKRRQRMTMLFRFMEFCIFFVIISRFSTQLPLSFKLSTEYYFKGIGVTLISPLFVFVLGNAIVIILYLKSGHSSPKDDSTNNVKIDLYDEYKQKCSMNKEVYCEQGKKQSILVEEAYCEQSKKQSKQSIPAEKAYCEQSKKQRKQSIVAERRVEKAIRRSHSGNSLCLSHDEKKHPRQKMIRSATVGCLKVINTDNVKPERTTTTTTTTSYPEDGMSSDEFRKTVEAFIARQQRFLREQEFSDVVSS